MLAEEPAISRHSTQVKDEMWTNPCGKEIDPAWFHCGLGRSSSQISIHGVLSSFFFRRFRTLLCSLWEQGFGDWSISIFWSVVDSIGALVLSRLLVIL
jgi:hypothetical protein